MYKILSQSYNTVSMGQMCALQSSQNFINLGMNYPSSSLAAELHQVSSISPLEMNPYKGQMVESLMSKHFTKTYSKETIPWVEGTPGRIGRTGIDGLFFKTDHSGDIVDLMVVEAKFGSSKLGITNSGRQMSKTWNQKRLNDSKQSYLRLYNKLESHKLSRSFSVPCNQEIHKVPLKSGKLAEVWQNQNGELSFFSRERNVKVPEIKKQVRKTISGINSRETGKSNYQAKLIRYKSVGKEHYIEIKKIPINPNELPSKNVVIKGEYTNLSQSDRVLLFKTYKEQFISMGKTNEEARIMAEKSCNDPEYFRRMGIKPKYSWKLGLDKQVLKVSAYGGLSAFSLDAIVQLFNNEAIDWERSIKIGILTTISTFVGQYGNIQIKALLITTKIGDDLIKVLPKITTTSIGASAGSILGSVVYAYGLYLLGYIDLKSANRMVLGAGSGILASLGFTAGTFISVAAFGTAGTGVAISTLSGAAMTNAVLAWLGGGSIATGGGGMAVGSIVLASGAAIILIAVPFAVGFGFNIKDKWEQETFLEANLNLVIKHISQGNQLEWVINK